MALWILVNIASVNGLLPDSTKPLPEPMLAYQYHLWDHEKEISMKFQWNDIFFIKAWKIKFTSSCVASIMPDDAMGPDVTSFSWLSTAYNRHRDQMCMCPAHERWCYIVTSSLIGWAHIQNDLCRHRIKHFYNMVDFLFGCLQLTPHSSPMRVSHGVRLWVQSLINVSPILLLCWVQYHIS